MGALDIGFYNCLYNNNFSEAIKNHIQKNKPVVFLLGLDDIDFSILEGAYVVYLGHHGDKGAHIADVVLPTPAFPEKTSTFVNMEGRVIQTTKCFNPIGDAKDEWKIFRSLSDKFENTLKFNNINELRSEIINQYKFLKELNSLPNLSLQDFGSFHKIQERKIKYNISNFYIS